MSDSWKRIALNLAGYQGAWWACVLSVRGGMPWVGLLVTACVLIMHLLISPARRGEFWSIPLAAAVGYAADTLATLVGALEFGDSEAGLLPTPLWIGALWLAFGSTICTCFGWLKGRVFAAALMGATSGPMAYGAGAALGVVTFPHFAWSMTVLAVLWGLVVPVAVAIVMFSVAQDATLRNAPPVHAGEMA